MPCQLFYDTSHLLKHPLRWASLSAIIYGMSGNYKSIQTPFIIISPLIAITSALLVGAIFILWAGGNPLVAYGVLVKESIFTYFGFDNTLNKMTPLFFTSLGVLLALRAGQFNIGGEGQIYLGALGSTLVGLYVQGFPPWLHIP